MVAAPLSLTAPAIAVSVDTLVEGVHFDTRISARALGHKALAVNLSDLAAMGAQPCSALVTLTRPPSAPSWWLEEFAAGLLTLATRFKVTIGGAYLAAGATAVTVEVVGSLPESAALRRSGAEPGDHLYVTGTLGDAGFALRGALARCPPSDRRYLVERLHRPTPRVEAGLGLRELASAAIDLSDGLASDLPHLLEASRVGAEIRCHRLPISAPLRRAACGPGALRLALSAGDDYELLFAAPPRASPALALLQRDLNCPFTRIGRITEPRSGRRYLCRWLSPDGTPMAGVGSGYRHF